jgi:hypothetical protein
MALDKLPMGVLMIVACYLDTDDFINLCGVCRYTSKLNPYIKEEIKILKEQIWEVTKKFLKL